MQPIKPKGEAEQEETFFSKYVAHLNILEMVSYWVRNCSLCYEQY